ncbi:hypothetical protein P7C70_g7529, partial [Phenoliferia sp. Uapishka_3]
MPTPARKRLQETSKDIQALAEEAAQKTAAASKEAAIVISEKSHDAAVVLGERSHDAAVAINEKSKEAAKRIDAGDWPKALLMLERRVHSVTQLLQGKVGSNSHPLHPALIHLPLAFLLASLSLDAFHLAGPHLPLFLTSLIFTLTGGGPRKVSVLNEWSYFLAGAGLLTSLPATTTGLAEFYEMTRSRVMEFGWKELGASIFRGDEPKIVANIRHAGAMDTVLVLVSYTFFERRFYMRNIPELLNTYHTSDTHLWVSSAALVILMYGAYKGGDLVYAHGVGVQRQGSALKAK